MSLFSEPEMPEAQIQGDPELAQPQPLLNIEVVGHGSKVHSPSYVSYRVTTTDFNLVCDLFRNCKVVIASEVSGQGVQHYHIVMEGHENYETVRTRFKRAKFGPSMSWSAKDWKGPKGDGDFWTAVSYTIKCGDYITRKGFHEYTDYVETNCPWVNVENIPVLKDDKKDVDRDWMLTYNNLLRVAHNHSRKYDLKTDDLGSVLHHLMLHTRWIPSPQMLKTGLDPWHFKTYQLRVGTTLQVPDWWTPRSI